MSTVKISIDPVKKKTGEYHDLRIRRKALKPGRVYEFDASNEAHHPAIKAAESAGPLKVEFEGKANTLKEFLAQDKKAEKPDSKAKK